MEPCFWRNPPQRQKSVGASHKAGAAHLLWNPLERGGGAAVMPGHFPRGQGGGSSACVPRDWQGEAETWVPSVWGTSPFSAPARVQAAGLWHALGFGVSTPRGAAPVFRGVHSAGGGVLA